MSYISDGEQDVLNELNADAAPSAGEYDEEEYDGCQCQKPWCGECESRHFKAYVPPKEAR